MRKGTVILSCVRFHSNDLCTNLQSRCFIKRHTSDFVEREGHAVRGVAILERGVSESTLILEKRFVSWSRDPWN